MDTATLENFSLSIKRNFNAPKQAVYEAWTREEALTAWFAPVKEMTTVIHILELRVGGQYKFEIIETNGTSHVIHGEYVELNPYDQLVFTWKWESDEDKVNSLVTIDLTEKDGITELVLNHEKLTSQESSDLHSEGWNGCLAQLDHFIQP